MLYVSVNERVNNVYTAVLNKLRLLGSDNLAFFNKKLAVLVYDIFVSGYARKPYAHIETFVEFISADLCAVVSSRVEEKVFKMLTNGFLGGNFARAQSSVQLEKTFAFGFRDVFFHRRANHRIVLENFLYALVRSESERAEKNGCGELTRSVDFNPQGVVRVLLELDPRASVGDNGRSVKLSARFREFETVVNAGRTNELGNDYTFRSVYDKRTVLRHFGKLAHENVLIENFARNFVNKPYFYF